MAFDFRGLEMHGRRMWERRAIIEALDFIERHDMTALVLHETDMLHQVLFPRAYFDPYAQWTSAPSRRGENAIQNNRLYLDHVLNLADARDIEVWLEIKELGFPDEVIEMRPDLLKNGQICPSEPFWTNFLETMVEELYADFPKVAGLIVSTGSPEGRASRAQNKCQCALCRETNLEDWYHDLIMAMWRPTAKKNKRLAIRDFAYTPENHEPLIAAMERTPNEIIFCIKATPHDFYPTFPDNPAFGRLSRTQWMEYDTMGQFYGLGGMPCFVGEDLARRIAHAQELAVTGAVFRVEWERVNDWWVLECLNEVNLIAAAALARGDSPSPVEVCRLWLESHDWPTDGADWLAAILADTWPIMKRTLYLDGFMFADSSFFPRSIGRAWWTVETKHSLAAWAPSRAGDMRLDSARITELIAEKAEAVSRVRAFADRLGEGDPSIPEALQLQLLEQANLFVAYVEGFQACAKVCIHARAVGDGITGQIDALAGALDELEAYGETIRPLSEEARYPHQVLLLLDYRRVVDIVAEGRQILTEAAGRAV
jgi:hypothetical protein